MKFVEGMGHSTKYKSLSYELEPEQILIYDSFRFLNQQYHFIIYSFLLGLLYPSLSILSNQLLYN